MNELPTPAVTGANRPSDPRVLLASRKHTLIFLLICVAITVTSAMNAGHSGAAQAPVRPSQMIQLYVFLIVLEWLWVRFVMRGMKPQGRSIREFLGQRWATPSKIAIDLAYAALAFAVIYGIAFADSHLWPQSASPDNPLLPSIPAGALGVSVWIGLSVSAGICEEIVFRGYLQRQLAAISGKPVLAIVGQAVIFGIAHGYEGLRAVLFIVVYGLLLGSLAAWRGNIRAGIWEHVVWDILAGLGLI
ncbi:MAG: CPBP family intramembrane glutamic endopeptidase [Steroidobacteraceae bacterium]